MNDLRVPPAPVTPAPGDQPAETRGNEVRPPLTTPDPAAVPPAVIPGKVPAPREPVPAPKPAPLPKTVIQAEPDQGTGPPQMLVHPDMTEAHPAASVHQPAGGLGNGAFAPEPVTAAATVVSVPLPARELTEQQEPAPRTQPEVHTSPIAQPVFEPVNDTGVRRPAVTPQASAEAPAPAKRLPEHLTAQENSKVAAPPAVSFSGVDE